MMIFRSGTGMMHQPQVKNPHTPWRGLRDKPISLAIMASANYFTLLFTASAHHHFTTVHHSIHPTIHHLQSPKQILIRIKDECENERYKLGGLPRETERRRFPAAQCQSPTSRRKRTRPIWATDYSRRTMGEREGGTACENNEQGRKIVSLRISQSALSVVSGL